MSIDPKDLDRKMWWLSLMCVLLLAGLIFGSMHACGLQPAKRVTVEQPGPEVPVPYPVPTPVPVPVPTPGDDDDDAGCDGQVVFADVAPILTQACVGCHYSPGKIDTYEVASAWAEEIVRRVNLSDDNRDRMPLVPAPALSVGDKQKLEAWVAGGKREVCDPGRPGRTFLDLDYIEGKVLEDLNKLDARDRPNTRYLLTAHKVDEGLTGEELDVFVKAMNKTLNSLNPNGDEIFKVTPVDENRSVWRFDINTFDIGAAEWKVIEDANKLKFVSNTDRGKLIRQLVGVDQVLIHADNFFDVTLRNATVYYTLLEVPGTLAELQAAIGVNFNQALQDLEAVFVGGNSSPISLLKNRLIVRVDGGEGSRSYYWQTFDPIDPAGVPERNLFAFPFLAATGGSKVFDFAASEVIYSLPNGLQGYALFNAAGVRQDAAPLNVVADNRPGPLGPEIKTAISCFKCHSVGLIPMRDEVRDHVIRNASTFNALDVEIAKALYAPANVVTARFTADNRELGKFATEAGFSLVGPDPVNACTDQFLSDWDAKRVASFLFLTETEFKELLPQSAEGVQQVGQLLTGGLITYNQFIEVFPILVRDLRLFEEPLAE